MPLLAQTNILASAKKGCDTLTVKFSSNTSALSTIKWTFGDGEGSIDASPQHKYLNPGKYSVSLTIDNNDPVEEPGLIEIGTTPDASFQFHDTLEFSSHNIAFNPIEQAASDFSYNYSWTISDGASGNTANFVHQFDTTGTYSAKLIITDILGCADTLVRTLEIANKLDVPNVFTPNDDTVNDLLIIEGDNLTTYSIQIFSRSGIKVFEASAKVLVWDGRMFSGEKVRDGIYYYVIESKNSPVKLKQNGFFYIYGSYQ